MSGVNPGTSAVQIKPYTEDDYGGSAVYQTISAQTECEDFSLEELRLVDYEHKKDDPSTKIEATNVRKGRIVGHFNLDLYVFRHIYQSNAKLGRLRGPGIEIRVGTPDPQHTDNDASSTWSLPQSLISHFSPFLKAACERDFKERQEGRINLPEDDPEAFSRFVEWLYYGDYGLPPISQWGDPSTAVSVNARCWALGDKLLCPEFQNCAMRRLYAQHSGLFARSMTIGDVQFACENSAVGSKLRRFCFGFAVAHFGNPNRLRGATEQWNELLASHDDLRLLLLQSFRAVTHKQEGFGGKADSLGPESDFMCEIAKLKIGDAESSS